MLRREFRLKEGDLFNNIFFHQSLAKVNQLGYFQIDKAPNIKAVTPDSDRVDVTVSGEEKSQNSIEVGAGFSGLEGFFAQTSYSTRNFLGKGEILQLSVRGGGRENLYSVSFTEPWMFDRPYTGGFSLFRLDRQFTQFNQRTQGGSLTVGSQLTYFSRGLLTYRYEVTDILPHGGFSTQSANFFGNGTTTIAQIVPAFQYDTRNNFYHPTKGFFYMAALPIATRYVGSQAEYFKITSKATWYIPSWKKTFFAFNGEFGHGRTLYSNDELPPSERYFLGGSNSVRGYFVRSIGPEFEGFVYGGDSYLQFNAEYAIPLNDLMQIAFYFDAGDTFAIHDISLTDVRGNPVRIRKPFSFDLRRSAGAEFRFFVPQFPYPIRLIWSKPLNPAPGQRTQSFEFTIGPSF